MTTDYISMKPIHFNKIKGLKFGHVYEVKVRDTRSDNACLTDGENYLWAFKVERGKNTAFQRAGGNDVEFIIEFLENKFKTKLVSEHDDEYAKIMGFDW